MTLETLIGIGGSHNDDVSHVATEVLRNSKPDLITIEASPGEISLTKGGQQLPQITPGQKRIHGVTNVDARKRHYFIDGKEFIKLPVYDAPNAALEYALDSGTPVYFIDNPLNDGKTIIGIDKIQGNQYFYTTLTLPPPTGIFAPDREDRGFDPRNKDMARAILFLAELYKAKKIAHAGGMGHFKHEYRTPTTIIPRFSLTTIQELVSPQNFNLYGTSGIVRVDGG